MTSVSISAALSFCVGAGVGSVTSILVLCLFSKRRGRSLGSEWLFSAGVDAPLTTEILEERRSLSTYPDERPTSSSTPRESDTPLSPPSFRQALLGLGSQGRLSTEIADIQNPTGGLLDPHSGPTKELK